VLVVAHSIFSPGMAGTAGTAGTAGMVGCALRERSHERVIKQAAVKVGSGLLLDSKGFENIFVRSK
jgi:hypothetical protein